jgi:diaminopimelate epimerase
MSDVTSLNREDESSIVLDTGSPHYIRFHDHIENMNVYAEGKAIRNSPKFIKEGINVNFVDITGNGEITIKTYERGVEDETFACGTGVVASAIASAFHGKETITDWLVHAKGGDLHVTFQKNSDQNFTSIKLTGPAVEVYKGEIPIATIATI